MDLEGCHDAAQFTLHRVEMVYLDREVVPGADDRHVQSCPHDPYDLLESLPQRRRLKYFHISVEVVRSMSGFGGSVGCKAVLVSLQ